MNVFYRTHKKKSCHVFFHRYKLIVVVTIGEKYLQDVSHSVSFLWDADRDGYSSYVYERPDLFVIATLYAVYYE